MIDLYSDTKTRPTAAMRNAIAEAVVGDEQQNEDPTVSRLLERFEWMAKGSEVLSWVFAGLVVFGVGLAAWGLYRSIREGRLG